ncbi:MAG: DUF3616 domain-containing protein [Chromatiaceae bacterium]|nr:DUF3616 domain-containing protein [Chromatiaceae bacterium]
MADADGLPGTGPSNHPDPAAGKPSKGTGMPVDGADDRRRRTKKGRKKTAPGPAAEPNDKDSGASADSGVAPAPSRPIGSGKGIETLFRSVYLADTEMIALAATKANIMISLNGFIVSALMISGAFIYASSPAFLVPAGAFLFTAAFSIYFALLAASPDLVGLPRRLWTWLKEAVHGRASLRDLPASIRREPEFTDGVSNILIYEDRIKLTREAYWDRMRQLLGDQEAIYQRMSEQLYWLGEIANKKFEMLKISYSIFRWGLVLSVILFFSVKSFEEIRHIFVGAAGVRLQSLSIGQFDDVYEPSGVVQLADGRLLVVEDESKRALRILTATPEGTLVANELLDTRIIKSFGRKLDDLEGASMDARGYVWAITSHARTEKGKRQPDREQLVRFRIEGNNLLDFSVYTQLTDDILASGVVRDLAAQHGATSVNFASLNIEGLNFDKAQQRLLIGFREPMINGQSLILAVENPRGLFERGESARLADDPILLDLGGGGIRGLSYDPILGSFLIVNEITGDDGKPYSQLWSWSGNPGDRPEPLALPGIVNLSNVEAVASVRINGEPRLVIMSDEGVAKKQLPAKYMLLEYTHLSRQ